MANAEQEAEEYRASFAAEHEAEAVPEQEVAAAEDSDFDIDDFDWSRPDPEEKVAAQRALVESFETKKEAEDATIEALQQRLEEDAAPHRALAAAWRRKEGGIDGARPSGSK
jgi:hypothetical protein